MKQVKLVQHPADDLDVAALFQNAFRFFSQYGKLLFIVAFTGMLAGALRYYTTPNLYTSTLVIQPTLLNDPEQMELINNWAELLKKKEFTVLAKQFNTDPLLFKKVLWIKTEELQKSTSPNNFTAFTLSVLVSDTTVLRPLQAGIEYASDNTAYIKDKLASRKNILRTLIQTIDQELKRLYALQLSIENNLQQNNAPGGKIMIDASGISSQIATLQEKKLNLEENLTFTSAVHVIQNFYIPGKPTYPQLIKQLLLGLGGGSFLGLAIAGYLHLRRKTAPLPQNP